MTTTVRGVFREGKIELFEVPDDVHEEAAVIVTFVDEASSQSPGVDLRSLGIDRTEAARLRASLASFAEEWDSPEMDIYDDYDAAKAANDSAWRRSPGPLSSLQPGIGEGASRLDRAG